MRQRTALAVAAATVAVAASGTVAAVAVTGGHLFGLGRASAAISAATPVADTEGSVPKVVVRTKYHDVKVVVTTTPTPQAASGRRTSRGSKVPASSGPSGSSAPTTPAPSTAHRPGPGDRPNDDDDNEPPTTPPTSPPTSTPPTSTPPTTGPPIGTPQQQTIQTAAGSIDVQFTATALHIVAIHPNGGITAESETQGASAHVEFHGQPHIEVNVSVQNGQLRWSVDS